MVCTNIKLIKKQHRTKTISEKAEIAIKAINSAIAEIRCQIRIGRLDKSKADMLIFSAQKKAKATHNAYFNRYPKDRVSHLNQLQEVSANRLIDDLIKANDQLDEMPEVFSSAIPILKCQQQGTL